MIKVTKDRRLGLKAKGSFISRCGKRKGYREGGSIEKCAFMVNASDTRGFKALSATDMAIYEYLYAHARKEGIQAKEYTLELAELMDFTGTRTAAQIVKSIERISKAAIKYRVRCPQTHTSPFIDLLPVWCLTHPLTASGKQKKVSKKSVLAYSFDDLLKFHVANARSYGWVDLRVFAKFKNKYSSRLYSKLSVIAGYDQSEWRKWEPTIEELAIYLGYAEKGASFNRTQFKNTVFLVIDDIIDAGIDFTITAIDAEKGNKFSFNMSAKKDSIFTQKISLVSDIDHIDIINNHLSKVLKPSQFPKFHWLAQAETYLFKKKMFNQPNFLASADRGKAHWLAERWEADYIAAKNGEGLSITLGKMSPAKFVDLVDKGNTKEAFALWINRCLLADIKDLGSKFDAHLSNIPSFQIYKTVDITHAKISKIKGILEGLDIKDKLPIEFFTKAQNFLKSNSSDSITAEEISTKWATSIAAARMNQNLFIGGKDSFEIINKLNFHQQADAFDMWLNRAFKIKKRQEFEFVPDERFTSITEEPPAEFDEMEELYLEQLIDRYEAQDNSGYELELAADDEDIPF